MGRWEGSLWKIFKRKSRSSGETSSGKGGWGSLTIRKRAVIEVSS